MEHRTKINLYLLYTFKSNFLFLFPKKKTFKSYLTSWLQAWFTWTLKRYGKLHHFVSTHIVCRYPEDKIRKSYTHSQYLQINWICSDFDKLQFHWVATTAPVLVRTTVIFSRLECNFWNFSCVCYDEDYCEAANQKCVKSDNLAINILNNILR